MNYHFFLDGPFSNWYNCTIQYDSKSFDNSEQLFMYLKAKVFGDTQSMEKILKTPNPEEVKKLGRGVANFNPAIWDNIKYEMMYLAVLLKVQQNSEVSEYLFDTYYQAYQNILFVECNPLDRIWGIGYSIKDAINNPTTWGQNLLGKILTDIAGKL